MRMMVGFVTVPVAAALTAAWTVLNFAVPSDETTKVPERLLTSGIDFEEMVGVCSPALRAFAERCRITKAKRNVETPHPNALRAFRIRLNTLLEIRVERCLSAMAEAGRQLFDRT